LKLDLFCIADMVLYYHKLIILKSNQHWN